MSEQREFAWDSRWKLKEQWGPIRALFELAANGITLKELAYALGGMNEKLLNDAIDERERKGARLKWLVAAAIVAKNDTTPGGEQARAAIKQILVKVGEILGFAVEFRDHLSKDEIIARYDAEAERRGVDGVEMKARVYGRLTTPEKHRR